MQDQQDTERQRLEAEISGDGYVSMLELLKAGNPALRRYRGWAEVLQVMRCGTSRDRHKDEILRPILRARSVDDDPRWLSLLLAIFWPGLKNLSFQKRKWDRDQKDRWQNVLCAFLRAVRGIDVSERPFGLVQRCINGSAHRLYDIYRVGKEPPDRERLPRNLLLADDGQLLFEIRDLQEVAMAEIQSYLSRGWIDQDGFDVFVETRLRGRKLTDYARSARVSYPIVRKRRWRTERAIRWRRGLSPRGSWRRILRCWEGVLTP